MYPGSSKAPMCRALLAMLATLTVALGLAPGAQAITTPGFKFTNLKITSGEGDTRTFSFDWSAASLTKNLESGDGFEIIPNSRLIYTEGWATTPLTVGDTEIGSCRVEHFLLSCTTDERVSALGEETIPQGSISVGVDINPQAQSGLLGGYTAPTITFHVNNRDMEVDFPDGIAPMRPFTGALQLEAYQSRTDFDHISWTATFNPGVLATRGENLPTPNGEQNVDYKMQVTLPAGMDTTHVEKFPWTLRALPTSGVPSTLASTAGSVRDGFNVKIEGKGPSRTVTLSGPFNNTDNYQLYMAVPTAQGQVRHGAYEMSLSLDGHDEIATATFLFQVPFPTREGIGVLNVKTTSTTDIPVPVFPTGGKSATITFDLPGETTVADYPNWFRKPTSIAADAKEGSYTTYYSHAAAYTPVGTFPVGTVVTFTPQEPEWAQLEYDKSKTTITPQKLTVAEGSANRMTVGYEITSRKLNPIVSANAINEDQAIVSSGGEPFDVNYRCFTSGEETDSGTLKGLIQGRGQEPSYEFDADTCTFTVDQATVPTQGTYHFAKDLSTLEVTISKDAPVDNVTFTFIYLKTPTTPAENAAGTPTDTSEEKDLPSEEPNQSPAPIELAPSPDPATDTLAPQSGSLSSWPLS